jgi:hypothetical protein
MTQSHAIQVVKVATALHDSLATRNRKLACRNFCLS